MGIKHSRPVPPFMRYCSAIIPTMFDDSLSYYEALCALNRFIQTNLVEVINNNAVVTEEYIKLVDDLKEYVEHYFDNLDVQEEINNKLDSMVEDGTLQQIVSEYYNDKVEYIFPKFWANAYSGDANLIKVNDKVIMIDCYTVGQWANVRSMLEDNGVEHIDYFVLTHYHPDHEGNFENLVAYEFIDSNTQLYFPAPTTHFYAEKPAYYQNYCETHNLTYYVPSEGEVLEIGAFKMTFFNCDVDAMDALYWDGGGDYNDYSIINLCEYRDSVALFTGDASSLAYKRMYDTNFVKGRVNLHKIGHHGINVDTYLPFVRAIQPDYAVQPAGIMDATINNFGVCSEVTLLRKLGTLIYPTYMQEDYINFTVNGSSIECVSGTPAYDANGIIPRGIYVNENASTASIQDGSQQHPFATLMQAIAIVDGLAQENVVIRVADGTYGYEHPTAGATHVKNSITIRTGNTRVRIEGNSEDNTAVVLNGIEVQNSDIELKDLTVDCKNRHGIESRNSKILLDNVAFTTSDGQVSGKSCVVLREQSNLVASSSSFDNANYGILANDSYAYLNEITFGSNLTTLFSRNRSEWVTRNITFADATQKKAFDSFNAYQRQSELLYRTDTIEYSSVNLAKPISGFDWIEIYYKDNDGYAGSVKVFTTQNKTTGTTQRNNGTILFVKNADFGLSGSTITISHQMQAQIKADGNVIVTSSNYLGIYEVVGGYNTMVNMLD